MYESLLAALPGSLDIVLLAPLGETRFRILCDPPPFMACFFRHSPVKGEELDFAGTFEVLHFFLSEAEEFWQTAGDGMLDSDVWLETDNNGTDHTFEASATFINGQRVLLLKKMGKAFRTCREQLQSSREVLLTKEFLEAEVARRTKSIRDREEEIALRLVVASDYRDEETGAHIRRIGLYAEQLSIALDWTLKKAYDLRIAASMHDVGKIGIPDAILLKPGKLNASEMAIMKSHTEIGARMLAGSDISLLRMARDIALHHHEHWDGHGYPDGLQGEDIPESARITTVCDVYDALIQDRAYRKALPEHEALSIMREERGKLFDPRIFDKFLELLPTFRRIRLANTEEDGVKVCLSRSYLLER